MKQEYTVEEVMMFLSRNHMFFFHTTVHGEKTLASLKELEAVGLIFLESDQEHTKIWKVK